MKNFLYAATFFVAMSSPLAASDLAGNDVDGIEVVEDVVIDEHGVKKCKISFENKTQFAKVRFETIWRDQLSSGWKRQTVIKGQCVALNRTCLGSKRLNIRFDAKMGTGKPQYVKTSRRSQKTYKTSCNNTSHYTFVNAGRNKVKLSR